MNHTILVIEDELDVRSGIAEILGYEDMEVATAKNGDEGIKLAQKLLPDLIICDISMPVKNGYDVLLELQQDMSTANIPFIFLTARADQSALRYGMQLGADDYLTKPFHADELVSAINTRLAKKARIIQEYTSKAEELHHTLLFTLPQRLRIPLSGMIGGAEMLLMDRALIDSDHTPRIANLILRSGQRLHHMIENYLLLAQLEVFQYDPQRQESLLQESTDKSHIIIRDAARKRADHANRDADLNLQLKEMSVSIAAANLSKVVEELVDNAFKFSQPGTPVTISTETQGNKFILKIIDHGHGMTAEQIEQLSTTIQVRQELYEQKSFGLGFIIAQRLVELQKGEIAIESEPNKGTTISVYLTS